MSDDRDYRPARKTYGKSGSGAFGILSKLIALAATAVGAYFVYRVYSLNILPPLYLGVGAAALGILLLLIWILVFRRGTAPRVIGALFAILIGAGLGVGAYFLQQTEETLVELTGTTVVTQKDEVAFIVLGSSEIQTLNSLGGSRVGIQASLDRANTDKALRELENQIGNSPVLQEFTGMGDMVQALFDGQVDAILFNESYRDLVNDEFPDFDDDTRIVDTVTYETEVKISDKEETESKDVLSESFIIYFSGIDTYGDITARSRSDVNIMAIVNPTTHQILLVTTPRDYYVQVPAVGNELDKLTHAGIYGVDASIATLEQLYNIDINYYVRMNFTGFMNIVDALGGVEVYSSQSFTGEVYGYYFSKGYNTVNGEQALSFVRERHSFADGDTQRAKNQMEMIKAITKKIASPTILTSYTSLLNSLSNSFTTDIPSEKILELVKMQLSYGGGWDIESFSVYGKGARRTTYSMGNRSLYVALQDTPSIEKARSLMLQVMDGTLISDLDLTERVLE